MVLSGFRPHDFDKCSNAPLSVDIALVVSVRPCDADKVLTWMASYIPTLFSKKPIRSKLRPLEQGRRKDGQLFTVKPAATVSFETLRTGLIMPSNSWVLVLGAGRTKARLLLEAIVSRMAGAVDG